MLHSEIIAVSSKNTMKSTNPMYGQNADTLVLTQVICTINGSVTVFLCLRYIFRMDNANLIANFAVDREHPVVKAKFLVIYRYCI